MGVCESLTTVFSFCPNNMFYAMVQTLWISLKKEIENSLDLRSQICAQS